jgi:signal transduction histidine kinase
MGASALEQGGLGPPAAAHPPRLLVLWAVGLAGCAAAALEVVVVLRGDHGDAPGVQAALVGWITLAYVTCGLVAWWRRPGSRFGLLMIAAGFAPALSRLSLVGADLPYTVGEALRLLPTVVFLHVFLAYPSGRLERRFERRVVGCAYAAAIGLALVQMLLASSRPGNLLGIVDQPEAAAVLRWAQLIALSVLVLAGVGVLVERRWGAGRPLRRSRGLLVDSFVLALVLIAAGMILSAVGGATVEPMRWAAFALIGVAPVAFLFGLLHVRLARSSVGELVVELRADPGPADLRDALARALGDPSLTLAYWLPAFDSYADLHGRAVVLGNGDERATTLIDRDGTRVAALLHDPALNDEPELLRGVTAAAGIALEKARLQAELSARLEELRGSRARIVDAGQNERQRLERNLHDGAQQRLIALSLELGLLEARMKGDPEARARLAQARREIATSLEELRAVARGIHPAVVSGHGLAVALEQLAARAGVPVGLSVRLAGRLPERIEVAAFYLVSESLANVTKHASATSATVEVGRANGEVVVEVVDDGIGGADTELGTGLRGLADRVEALGGRLRVWSPRGGGTRLRAEIPCEP